MILLLNYFGNNKVLDFNIGISSGVASKIYRPMETVILSLLRICRIIELLLFRSFVLLSLIYFF